jgi:hypothetical protein
VKKPTKHYEMRVGCYHLENSTTYAAAEGVDLDEGLGAVAAAAAVAVVAPSCPLKARAFSPSWCCCRLIVNVLLFVPLGWRNDIQFSKLQFPLQLIHVSQ